MLCGYFLSFFLSFLPSWFLSSYHSLFIPACTTNTCFLSDISASKDSVTHLFEPVYPATSNPANRLKLRHTYPDLRFTIPVYLYNLKVITMAPTRLDRAIRGNQQTFLLAFTGIVLAASAFTYASSFFPSETSTKDKSFNDSLFSKSSKKSIPPEQKFLDTDEEREKQEAEADKLKSKNSKSIKTEEVKEEIDESEINNKSKNASLWSTDKLTSWLKHVCTQFIA